MCTWVLEQNQSLKLFGHLKLFFSETLCHKGDLCHQIDFTCLLFLCSNYGIVSTCYQSEIILPEGRPKAKQIVCMCVCPCVCVFALMMESNDESSRKQIHFVQLAITKSTLHELRKTALFCFDKSRMMKVHRKSVECKMLSINVCHNLKRKQESHQSCMYAV